LSRSSHEGRFSGFSESIFIIALINELLKVLLVNSEN
jgi:hypothetical protein